MSKATPGLTELQAHTLEQIKAAPGSWMLATCQPGFNLTSAKSLLRLGLVRLEKHPVRTHRSVFFPAESNFGPHLEKVAGQVGVFRARAALAKAGE